MRLFFLGLTMSCVGAFSPQLRAGLRSARTSLRMQDEFTIAILGDLHLDPRYMADHEKGREHFMPIVTDKTGAPLPRTSVVSLGDLGESKSVDETKQLFAGTSKCFKLAREYLDGYKVRCPLAHAHAHSPLPPPPSTNITSSTANTHIYTSTIKGAV